MTVSRRTRLHTTLLRQASSVALWSTGRRLCRTRCESGPEPSEPMSDVALASSQTGAAPTFRRRLRVRPAGRRRGLMRRPSIMRRATSRPAPMGRMALLPGAKVDDFEIVRCSAGAHSATSTWPGRLRSIGWWRSKVSANRGSEGRTMARLEHQHIVQVFSEKVDTEFQPAAVVHAVGARRSGWKN